MFESENVKIMRKDTDITIGYSNVRICFLKNFVDLSSNLDWLHFNKKPEYFGNNLADDPLVAMGEMKVLRSKFKINGNENFNIGVFNIMIKEFDRIDSSKLNKLITELSDIKELEKYQRLIVLEEEQNEQYCYIRICVNPYDMHTGEVLTGKKKMINIVSEISNIVRTNYLDIPE